MFVTSRNLLFGVYLPRKIITILRKIAVNFRQVSLKEILPSVSVLECFGEKVGSLKILYCTWTSSQVIFKVSSRIFFFFFSSVYFSTYLQEPILREKCPNTELFLVRISPHSDWIRRDTKYLFVFSPNVGKCGPEITPHLDTFHAVLFLSYIAHILCIRIRICESYYFRLLLFLRSKPKEK